MFLSSSLPKSTEKMSLGEDKKEKSLFDSFHIRLILVLVSVDWIFSQVILDYILTIRKVILCKLWI